jgi:hypothetical protein
MMTQNVHECAVMIVTLLVMELSAEPRLHWELAAPEPDEGTSKFWGG